MIQPLAADSYFSGMRVPSRESNDGSSSVTVFQTMFRSMSKQAWIKRFRMATIDDYGTVGLAARVSAETLDAASPMISMARTSAKSSI